MSVQFSNANGTATLVLTNGNGDTSAHVLAAINAATKSLGIYAVQDEGSTPGISIQSGLKFSVSSLGGATTASAAGGLFGMDASTSSGTLAVTAPTDAAASSTDNATVALSTITRAVSALGLVQGKVGAAQNKLNYAIQLAQSQISSFSAAESRIRDTDVAAEAANLTKASVLQQASIAAMAQANSAPQAVLALLR
jgi:flagellin